MEIDRIFNRDCLEGMREMGENSVDAIVCDPPYGLSFMGANWDHGVPGVLYWQEALRVAKPGTHLLAFGGSRTHHRLMVAIEDAGWEIRDCLMWIYGGGLPKGLDLSKGIDAKLGVDRVILGYVPNRWDGSGNVRRKSKSTGTNEACITAPTSGLARLWDGWNTSLKPAYEPIILARKPLAGTVAENILKWGCGGLNVDGCRIEPHPKTDYGNGTEDSTSQATPISDLTEQARSPLAQAGGSSRKVASVAKRRPNDLGRWPANLLFDEAAADLLDQQTGTLKSGANPTRRKSPKFQTCYGEFQGQEVCTPHRGANSGGASRFFYCAKASKKERSGSLHPTVKPLDLMRYLCRLVTPPGGLILDPFLGSGSTAVAAVHEGFRFVGFEIDETYCNDARRRIKEARQEVAKSRSPKSHPPEPASSPSLADFGAECP